MPQKRRITWLDMVDNIVMVSWVWYETATGGEATLPKLRRVWNHLLPLLPGLFYTSVLVPTKVQSTGQLNLFVIIYEIIFTSLLNTQHYKVCIQGKE